MSALIESAVCSDKGCIRLNNEDNLLYRRKTLSPKNREKGCRMHGVSKRDAQHFAVLDGMGGFVAGEDASLEGARRLAALLRATDPVLKPDEMVKGIQALSDAIHGPSSIQAHRTGTTLALLVTGYDCARVYYVGDSRVYLMRGGPLRQLTQDHSEIQRLMRMGIISPQEARTHPRRHVISQYIGMDPLQMQLSVGVSQPIPLRTGDWFLVCSDGLTDMLTDRQIETILHRCTSAVAGSEQLLNAALAAGGRDNITLCLVHVLRILPGERRKKLAFLCILASFCAFAALAGCVLSLAYLLGGIP